MPYWHVTQWTDNWKAIRPLLHAYMPIKVITLCWSDPSYQPTLALGVIPIGATRPSGHYKLIAEVATSVYVLYSGTSL